MNLTWIAIGGGIVIVVFALIKIGRQNRRWQLPTASWPPDQPLQPSRNLDSRGFGGQNYGSIFDSPNEYAATDAQPSASPLQATTGLEQTATTSVQMIELDAPFLVEIAQKTVARNPNAQTIFVFDRGRWFINLNVIADPAQRQSAEQFVQKMRTQTGGRWINADFYAALFSKFFPKS